MREFTINWAFPINAAAIIFGGWWALKLLGIHVSIGQYAAFVAVAGVTWLLANLKLTTTWRR